MKKTDIGRESVDNFRGYLGSETIKRTGVAINWTRDLIEEYIKCKEDPIYFAEKYMKIVHVDKGLITIPLYEYQKELITLAKDNRYVIAEQCRQSGKALPLDTLIPTPHGFKNMGDLQTGDIIFDEKGNETKILSTSNIFYDHDCYNITFDDNSSVVADSDHLWTVRKSSKKDKKYINLTTKELFDSGVITIDSRNKKVSKWKIPTTEPVQYKEKVCEIDPYTLGLWLGDGSAADGRITASFEDKNFYETVVPYKFSHNHTKKDLYTGTLYDLSPKLRKLNLLCNKHIPSEYLFNSVEKRIELLRGLMDSDGTVEKSGRLCIALSYNRYPGLIDDVYELLTGLGFKVFKKHYQKTNSFRLYFQSSKENMEVFKLPRKLEKQNKKQIVPEYTNFRFIRNIEKVKSVPTKCIEVENESHLFLCTKNYIPTHNTTAITVFVLWKLIFNQYERVAILANKQETSIEILSRIQLAYEHLPPWLQQGVVAWNKKSFELENGSTVLAAATGSGNIRGKSVTLLIVDEMAHIENWDEFYTSVYPTITSGKKTKVILISTVNGLNHFHEYTSKARAGKNDYKLVSVPWWKVPGRDAAWKDETLRGMNGDLEKFGQEYENEYLGSSGTLISGTALKKMEQHVKFVEALNSYEDQAGGLRQYVMPVPKNSYVLIADCSQGKGLDHSAFSIIDVTKHPYEQVCSYRNNMITPTEYAEIIHRMAGVYNHAMVLVELNDIGPLVINTLIDTYENENILYTENAGKMGKRICLGVPHSEPGVRTTKSVKALGCSMIKLIIEQDKLIVNDIETVRELSTFSRKANSWEAEDGKNDDLVMGLVLFGWLSDQRYFKELTNIDSLKLIRDKTQEELEAELLPFGPIADMDEIPEYKDYTEQENWKRQLYNKGFRTENDWFEADQDSPWMMQRGY